MRSMVEGAAARSVKHFRVRNKLIRLSGGRPLHRFAVPLPRSASLRRGGAVYGTWVHCRSAPMVRGPV